MDLALADQLDMKQTRVTPVVVAPIAVSQSDGAVKLGAGTAEVSAEKRLSNRSYEGGCPLKAGATHRNSMVSTHCPYAKENFLCRSASATNSSMSSRSQPLSC